MLLYECKVPNSEEHLDKWVQQKGAQCYTKNMPTSWNSCGSAIIAWAVGSEGLLNFVNYYNKGRHILCYVDISKILYHLSESHPRLFFKR